MPSLGSKGVRTVRGRKWMAVAATAGMIVALGVAIKNSDRAIAFQGSYCGQTSLPQGAQVVPVSASARDLFTLTDQPSSRIVFPHHRRAPQSSIGTFSRGGDGDGDAGIAVRYLPVVFIAGPHRAAADGRSV